MAFQDELPENSDNLRAYAGRWIARLWDRVVGQGGTPGQAERAAQAGRHKEVPQVSYVPTTAPLKFSPVLDRVREALPQNAEVYLVGGAVRDALLGQPSYDLDFTLSKDALKTARKTANALQGAYYRMDEEHQIGRVVLTAEDGARTILDFAAMQGKTLEKDLGLRDFTVNAMAVHIHRPQQLLDPLGGLSDLLEKRLRLCSPTAYKDDPVRTLRAIRMAAKYGLAMLPETKAAIKPAVPLLPQVSVERMRDELFKILAAPQPDTSLRAMEMLGMLPHTLPELAELKEVTQSPPHVYDVWEHTLHTVKRLEGLFTLLDTSYSHDNEEGGDIFTSLIAHRLGRYREQVSAHLNKAPVPERSRRALLVLAGLYHDITKPRHRTVEEDGRIRFIGHEASGAEVAAARGEKLHLSNPESRQLETIVRHHMRPWQLAKEEKPPSRRAVYRFWRAAGDAGVDICLLSVADLLGIYAHTLPQETLTRHLEVVRTLLEAYWEHREERVSPPPLLNGDDLMKEFKLKPGPRIGELLEALSEAQAAGEVAAKGDALEFVERWLERNND